MALYGVLGDIHGSAEALRAVLDYLERRGVEGLLCVGDVVGYNADSDTCAELLREHGALVIAGNHDLISAGRLGVARCANKVAYSLRRTRRAISPETAAWLAGLPARLVIDEHILLVHAGLRDVEQYVVGERQVRENATYLAEELPQVDTCFFGHVHLQKAFEVSPGRVRELAIDGPTELRGDRIHFINPGSVDAARRNGQRCAEFAVFDGVQRRLEFHRIAYDYAASEAKAAAGGYRIGPWADRLYSLRRRLTGSP